MTETDRNQWEARRDELTEASEALEVEARHAESGVRMYEVGWPVDQPKLDAARAKREIAQVAYSDARSALRQHIEG